MKKRIPLIDDAFLRLESRNQPLHIGVLMMLEPGPDAAGNFAAKLVARLRQSESAADLFNQRLADTRGAHYWEDSPDFDLDHHFVHLALPRPGRIRELFDMVSRLHGSHLDRAYPLWRVYLIEGIEDGRIALYMKVHHAMVDGVGGMQMLLRSMSTSRAESRRMPPLWEMERPRRQKKATPVVPAPALTSRIRMRSVTMESWRAAMPVIRKLRKTFRDYDEHNPDVAMIGEAPKVVFNEPISGTRRFSAQSYSRARIKRVATALDATSNDVILAMVSGALRRYLHERDELPESPLTAGVPISIRHKAGASDAANQVAFAISNLATHIKDPVERMRAIKRSMDYNKGQLQGLSSGQIQAYSSLSGIPGALSMLFGRKPNNTLGNVVVSNVPGPAKTLYWQGAKLSGIYPISLLIASSGLNFTIISRRDEVDFGIIACRRNMPSSQRLLEYLDQALDELERSVEKLAARKAKAKTKAKAKAKPKAKAKAKPKTKAKAKPETKASTKTKPKAKARAKTKAGAKAGTKAKPGSKAKTPTKSRSRSKAAAGR